MKEEKDTVHVPVGANVGANVGDAVGAFVSSRQIVKPAATFRFPVFHAIRSPSWTTTPTGPIRFVYFTPPTVK